MDEYTFDIAVIGGGVLGLETAMQLGAKGYKTVVLEKSKTLADGPSVRNQRFLHAGTYHGAQSSIEAVTVARQTKSGFEKIKRFVPDAIDSQPSYALFVEQEASARAVAQWEQAKVAVKPVSLDTFRAAHPEIMMPDLVSVFESEDRVVDVRQYMQKLIDTSLTYGVRFMTDAQVTPVDSSQIAVSAGGQRFTIKTKAVVVTAGYGLAEIYEQATGESLPVTYYKSHLFAFPSPPIESNILAVGRNTIMSATFADNAGKLRSIIGVNYSDYEVKMPDFIPDQQKIKESLTHIKAALPGISSNFMAYACAKPNIAIGKSVGVYSLSARVFSHPRHPSYIFAVPGKMTEAPIAAEAILANLEGVTPQLEGEGQASVLGHDQPGITNYPYDDFIT